MEHPIRSLFKSLSWRLIATVVTFLTAWLLTGTVEIAAKIGLLDTAIKLAVFYGHERAWNKLNFGKIKQPEYQI
jgi:uncharacterized membrane protein